jgi:hypothetical protein
MATKLEIEQATEVLVGKTVWRFRRAANMAMFDIGERITVPSTTGPKEFGEWALHIQCAWRIALPDRVLVGSRDINYPEDHAADDPVPEDFDWDRSATRLDRVAKFLFDSISCRIQRIRSGSAGRLQFDLEEDMSLEVFPDDSLSLENWRLFPYPHRPHFVVIG